MPFEAMCQHLVQNQFTSDAFQGDSDSYLFQWDTNVWESWPEVDGHNFKEDWDKEGHINHPKRSETVLTTKDIHQLLSFSCGCLLASMARSVNCHGRKSAVQVHLIGAKPIVQVKR